MNTKMLNLQLNLKLIRKVCGWTSAELSKLIGITRPTLSKMENSKDCLITKTQYIAIRKLIDYEITENNNELLGTIMRVCVDNDNVTTNEKKRIEDYVKKAKKGGIDNSTIAIGVAGIVGATLAALLTTKTVDWFAPLLKD